MINHQSLAVQRFNIEASSIIDEARYSIRNVVQLHLFNRCAGMSIKQVYEKLDKLEQKLK